MIPLTCQLLSIHSNIRKKTRRNPFTSTKTKCPQNHKKPNRVLGENEHWDLVYRYTNIPFPGSRFMCFKNALTFITPVLEILTKLTLTHLVL